MTSPPDAWCLALCVILASPLTPSSTIEEIENNLRLLNSDFWPGTGFNDTPNWLEQADPIGGQTPLPDNVEREAPFSLAKPGPPQVLPTPTLASLLEASVASRLLL